jgi:hypothetical protein
MGTAPHLPACQEQRLSFHGAALIQVKAAAHVAGNACCPILGKDAPMKKLAPAFSVVVIAMLTAPAQAEHWQHVTTSDAIVIEIDVDSIRKNSDGAKATVSAEGELPNDIRLQGPVGDRRNRGALAPSTSGDRH